MPDDIFTDPITVEEIIGELNRELAMRAQVYPQQVHLGRLRLSVGLRRNALLRRAVELLEVKKS